MNATTQLSGVRSPFSLSLGRFPFDELIHFSFVYCRYRRSYFDREDRDRSESCGVVGPARFLRSWVARKLADPMCRKVSAPSLTNIAFARGGPKWNGRSQPATLAKFEGVKLVKPLVALSPNVKECHVISQEIGT